MKGAFPPPRPGLHTPTLWAPTATPWASHRRRLRDSGSHTPGAALPPSPRGGHSSPFREGLGVRSASPPPHRWGAVAAVAQMCAALGEASAGGFPPPATRAARALSCRCPPRPSPGRQLRPAPRPQPLSQLSLGWVRAAGEQLQGVGGRVGCPRNGRKQSGCRGGGEGCGAGGGEGKAGGGRLLRPSPSASGPAS